MAASPTPLIFGSGVNKRCSHCHTYFLGTWDGNYLCPICEIREAESGPRLVDPEAATSSEPDQPEPTKAKAAG